MHTHTQIDIAKSGRYLNIERKMELNMRNHFQCIRMITAQLQKCNAYGRQQLCTKKLWKMPEEVVKVKFKMLKLIIDMTQNYKKK